MWMRTSDLFLDIFSKFAEDLPPVEKEPLTAEDISGIHSSHNEDLLV
jgi:hypothetical protein